MEDSGYFNASLYSPFGMAGVETLGYEIGREVLSATGRNLLWQCARMQAAVW